jgi:hypothetical protein
MDDRHEEPDMTKLPIAMLLSAGLALAAPAFADDGHLGHLIPVAGHAESPIVLPEDVQWRVMNPAGVEGAILSGDPASGGVYTMLLKVPEGTRIPPHTHADAWRQSVILQGTFHFAFGTEFDADALIPMGPGTFWTEAPDQPHFGEIRVGEGEVIALLTAMGPTSTDPVAAPE